MYETTTKRNHKPDLCHVKLTIFVFTVSPTSRNVTVELFQLVESRPLDRSEGVIDLEPDCGGGSRLSEICESQTRRANFLEIFSLSPMTFSGLPQ